MKYQAIYKCRLCGKLVRANKTFSGNFYADGDDFCVWWDGDKYEAHTISTHECGDGLGILDLVGIVPRKNNS